MRQINSLLGLQGKFFKKALDLNDKVSISLDEKTQLQNEAVQRKSDVTTLKNQFESLINKLKQKNNWNEAFDAQFLASLKNSSDRSLLTQAGGARKLLEAGAADFDGVRDYIEQEIRQLSSKQVGAHEVREIEYMRHTRAHHWAALVARRYSPLTFSPPPLDPKTASPAHSPWSTTAESASQE